MCFSRRQRNYKVWHKKGINECVKKSNIPTNCKIFFKIVKSYPGEIGKSRAWAVISDIVKYYKETRSVIITKNVDAPDHVLQEALPCHALTCAYKGK